MLDVQNTVIIIRIIYSSTLSNNYRLEDNMIKMEQYKQWLWFKKIRRVDLKGKEKILKEDI